MSDEERESLSIEFDKILQLRDTKQSWSTFFPDSEVAIVQSGRRHPLTAGNVEADDNMLIREFSLPKELHKRLGEERKTPTPVRMHRG